MKPSELPTRTSKQRNIPTRQIRRNQPDTLHSRHSHRSHRFFQCNRRWHPAQAHRHSPHRLHLCSPDKGLLICLLTRPRTKSIPALWRTTSASAECNRSHLIVNVLNSLFHSCGHWSSKFSGTSGRGPYVPIFGRHRTRQSGWPQASGARTAAFMALRGAHPRLQILLRIRWNDGSFLSFAK